MIHIEATINKNERLTESETANELRRGLYKLAGYGEPKNLVYIDINAVNYNHEQMKKIKQSALKKKDVEINTTKNLNEKLYEAISDIAIILKIFDGHISRDEIDECLSVRTSLYEIPNIFDQLLARAVKILFCIQNNFSDSIETVGNIISLMHFIVDEINEDADDRSFPASISVANNDINTDQLEIGMVVKNYKVLCELLEQETKTGKSRQLQIKDFSRYFEWQKSGQKFIITDIYETPLEKVDNRKYGNNSVYVKYIELILLQYLATQNGNTRTLTKKKWWKMLGMVNDKYGNIEEKKLTSLDYTVTPYEVKHFYQRCNKKLEQILFSALNNLKNRKLIVWELQTVIVSTGENGKEEYSPASDIDKEDILRVERYVLKQIMGYEKMIQVFCHFRQNEYYQKVNNILHDYYGWNRYFKQIKIIYVQKDVREAIPQTEVDLNKAILNEKIIDSLNNNAEKKYQIEKERWEKLIDKDRDDYWGECTLVQPSSEIGVWKIPDTYLTAQKLLTEELVRINKVSQISFDDICNQASQELDDYFLDM